MSNPRHLWSGDWELDSTAAREELARRRAQIEEPVAIPHEGSPQRARPSVAALALAWLRDVRERLARQLMRALPAVRRFGRSRQLRVAVLVATGMLVIAGAAYGVTTLFGGSGGPPPSTATIVHSWLGIDVAGSPYGIVVTDVVPGGPAQKAGLESGDLINQINNQPVGTVDAVSVALNGLHAGDTVDIQFSRGPVSFTTRATLSAGPPGSP